jgi:hypothetical protein
MPRKTEKLNTRIDPMIELALEKAAEDELRIISNGIEVFILR